MEPRRSALYYETYEVRYDSKGRKWSEVHIQLSQIHECVEKLKGQWVLKLKLSTVGMSGMMKIQDGPRNALMILAPIRQLLLVPTTLDMITRQLTTTFIIIDGYGDRLGPCIVSTTTIINTTTTSSQLIALLLHQLRLS